MGANDPRTRVDIVDEAEWNRIRAAGAATPLPAVGGSDKNKYLHTNGSTGAVEWETLDKELPTSSAGDKGKFLHLNGYTGNKEWANAPAELPTSPTTDGEYVLTCTVAEGTATIAWKSTAQNEG